MARQSSMMLKVVLLAACLIALFTLCSITSYADDVKVEKGSDAKPVHLHTHHSNTEHKPTSSSQKNKSKAASARELLKFNKNCPLLGPLQHSVIDYVSKFIDSNDQCTALTIRYMNRIKEDSKSAYTALREARDELNRQRVRKSSTIKHAEDEHKYLQHVVNEFERATIQAYGKSLPQACIASVAKYAESIPEVSQESNIKKVMMHYYRLLSVQVRIILSTCRGVLYFNAQKYYNYYCNFASFMNQFTSRGQQLNKELATTVNLPFTTMLIKRFIAFSFISVPYVLSSFVALCVFLLFPSIVAYHIVVDVIYHIWFNLFVLHHHYNMLDAMEMVSGIKKFGESLLSRQWATAMGKLENATLALVNDADPSYYNGILAVFILSIVAALAMSVMFWQMGKVWHMVKQILRLFNPFASSSSSMNSPQRPSNNKVNNQRQRQSGAMMPQQQQQEQPRKSNLTNAEGRNSTNGNNNNNKAKNGKNNNNNNNKNRKSGEAASSSTSASAANSRTVTPRASTQQPNVNSNSNNAAAQQMKKRN